LFTGTRSVDRTQFAFVVWRNRRILHRCGIRAWRNSMKLRIGIALAFLTAAPFAASAQSQDEQSACIGDAFSVCGHAIPDRGRVAACLADNINRISPACRAVMARYQRPPREAQRYTEERRYPRYDYAPQYSQHPQFGDRPWRREGPGYWREPQYDRMR
jgi:hypothetical protein